MAKKTTARPRRKTVAAGGCTIRMYCHGLGDCFLLSFPVAGEAKKRSYVMIDCGVILGTPLAAAKMGQVVDDIIATVTETNGKPAVDLLLVTHEHWDHVSGFVQVPDRFSAGKKGALTFDNVWLAWTEQDGHPVADKIRADRKAKGKALRAALTGPRAAASPTVAAAALEVLDFFGPLRTNKAALAAAGVDDPDSASTDAAMAWLRRQATDFCNPGEKRPVPGAAGVSLYVLGPPDAADTVLLRRDAPRKGRDEAYEADEKASPFAALEWMTNDDARAARAEAAAHDDDEDNDDGPPCPFEGQYRVSEAEALADPFFRERYGFADDPHGDAGEAWRRIEDEWLIGAAHLALKMDSDTNNTSLAVAFELPDGRTLIFPGDAQMGNWESWAGVTFDLGRGKTATGIDLLNRAVVYKVGHHGSHNATRKKGGLEEMTSGDLVALIPTDQAMAATKGVRKNKDGSKTDGWQMPFAPLYDRLQEVTRHRILRADRTEAGLDKEATAGTSASSRLWNAFRPRVRFSDEKLKLDPKEKDRGLPLYVEYTIPLDTGSSPEPRSGGGR